MMNGDLVLPRLLGVRARDLPTREAAVDLGGEPLTYAQLHERCLQWAGAFQRLDVDAGDTVVTMLPNRADTYCTWMGLGWLRAIEVPINTDYRGRMLSYVVNNSSARVVVVADRYLDRLSDVASQLTHVTTVVVVGTPDARAALPCRVLTDAELLAGPAAVAELEPPEEWDVACMIYTSGTTGASKGVLVPWGELHQWPAGMPPGTITEGESYYAYFPPFHVGGKSIFYITVLNKARAVFREAFSITDFWNDVCRYNCVVTGLPGPVASFLMSAPPDASDADNPLRSVTVAPVPSSIAAFEERFGVRVGTAFGTTEIGLPIITPDWHIDAPGSCGRRRDDTDPGYELRIVDEHDHDVPVGSVGELIVRSSLPWRLNRGYFEMPDKTAEAWRNGWFHTGDAFRVDDDGNYYFVDRLKDAIRRRGENISSVEVEAHILEHPDVVECAALGVPSEHGEDEVKIVVVPRPGSSLTEEGLVRHLIPVMPRFMVPRFVEFVDELPKTDATFRVRKVALRQDPFNDRTWDREAAGIVVPR